MSAAQARKPFRAIIVGGGLVALTAAHVFTKADIDFVILERHENLLPEIGSLLNIWPPTFRILDQLGLLDAMQPVLNVVNHGISMSAETGAIFTQINPDAIITRHHGYGVRIAHRPHYIEVLYQTLPDSAKERIKVKKHVINVNVSDDGVSVECADGTVEKGSIIIGADGVHSRVRQCMEALAKGNPPPDRSQPSKSPYVTTFRMLFGNIPVPPGLEPGFNYEGAAERVSTQLITGKSQAWLGVYEALDKPTSERIRYTDQDKEKILEKWGHLYVAPGLTVREAFALRVGSPGLISLEEGHVDKWTWKRIVLVGDAVRKLEPHAGLGYNSGVIDITVLANKLRRVLRSEPSPTTETLEAMFTEYQAERKKDEPRFDAMSRRRARMTAWLSPTNKIMTKYIAPWTNLAYYSMRYVMAPLVARVPVLEWLEEKGPPATPQVPYLYHPVPEGMELEGPARRPVSSRSSFSIYAGTVVLAAFAAVGFQYYRMLH